MSNEIEVIDIDNVGDYIARIRQFEQRHIAQWFFRGHSDNSFKLVPSLYRLSLEETFATWDDLERYMMDAFKRESIPFLEHIPADEMEWLALAQHYGLPTRLLDWTSNPIEEANEFLLNIFIRFRIAARSKAAIINELFTLGIHRGFIYPGLEGIAKRLQFEVGARHVRHTTEPQIFRKLEVAAAAIEARQDK
jgi:hypothetical protein